MKFEQFSYHKISSPFDDELSLSCLLSEYFNFGDSICGGDGGFEQGCGTTYPTTGPSGDSLYSG